jgi:hypothetical protein
MLASRVAHASAKGRSQPSGLPKPSWAYTKLATKTFRTGSPSKAALLDPVATCLIGERRAGDDLGHTLPICSEESGGIFGVTPKPFETWEPKGLHG